MGRPILVFLVFWSVVAGANEAPHASDAPIHSKSLLDARIHALPQDTVERYLAHVSGAKAYYVFQGQNELLAAQEPEAPQKALRIGEHVPVYLHGLDLFADTLLDDGYYNHLGALYSADAYGVRIQALLSELAPGDELYIIDPTAPRAMGPFGANDHSEDGVWLPMVDGDLAVLLVRSASSDAPPLTVTAYSHVFRDIDTLMKQQSCNNLIACETNPTIQDRSSAIGRYTFSSGFSLFLCSGSLVNNADTPQLEPYFLTANHCVDTLAEALSVEVFWDYRVATCDNSAIAPPLNSLPRSNGAGLLATSPVFDYTLLELNNVPSGPFGRTYLGWTTTLPGAGADVIGIHHPVGSHMRISYGDVTSTGNTSSGFQSQIRVEWFDGVTEGGSSGSPLMLDNGVYQIIGALSNGAVHVCPEDPSRNWDYYASFSAFFPMITDYLTGDGAPSSAAPCPANTTFKDHPELLDSLRTLRDSKLAATPLGRKLINDYYRAAPGLAGLVTASPQAKALFFAGAAPAAGLAQK